MILKASERGDAPQLARYLLAQRENDHVELHDVRGFASDDLLEAFQEADAIAKGTRCKNHLFSMSLNPPRSANPKIADFESAITDIEYKLGLANQPRAIVFHEKDGRRHAHVVWSRIDTDSMTALNMSYYKVKLRDLSKELYLEHGWTLPDGLRDRSYRDPLTFSRAEWEQARRAKLDPREIKALFKSCWETSDSQTAFQNVLHERGFWLARGDRRGYVAVDFRGEIYAIAKWSGVKAKDVRARFDDPDGLPSVDQVKSRIGQRMAGALGKFVEEIEADTRKHAVSLEFRRTELVGRQREERKRLETAQAARLMAETQARSSRLPKGIKGLWHRVTGQYAEIKRQNEREAWQAHLRDQAERDALILEQRDERRVLQLEIDERRQREREEQLQLRADIARYEAMQRLDTTHDPERTAEHSRTRDNSRNDSRGKTGRPGSRQRDRKSP